MKLVIDMNMSPEWAAVFLEAGFNATHWSLLGAVDAPDPDIMAFAAAYGYVVFTNDLDFGAILALTRAAGPSVVQVRASELLPEAIGPQVLEGLRDTQSELEQGALVTITPEKIRVRVLPLR